MTKDTFDLVMRKVFVPYVQSERIKYGLLPTAPAALVVDGHSSRYNPATLSFLKSNHIHLLVLPAHSSHILQPLDLLLNRLVKDKYKKEYMIALRKAVEKKKKE